MPIALLGDKQKDRARLIICVECKVTLRIYCFKIFHTVEEFVGHK